MARGKVAFNQVLFPVPLARMIHEGPAANPDLPAIAGVLGSRILDVL